MSESLFRKEVIRTQGERLLGEVTLSQPVSYYIYCFFLFSITFVALLFLAFNKYSRKQTVVGFLAPDNDVIRVYPPQTGILNQFLSDEGDHVYTHLPLFKLQIEQNSNGQSYVSDQVMENLIKQEKLLTENKDRERLFIQNLLMRHEEVNTHLQSEISQLENLRNYHKELQDLEEESYKRTQLLFAREAVSQSVLENARKAFLQSTIQLQNIDLSIVQKSSNLHESELDRENYIINSNRNIAAIDNRISEISKQKVTTLADTISTIHSPVNGRITSLFTEIGQRVSPNSPVLAITPENSVLEAQLYIPTRAIGFIQIGQAVKIKYDAFPYERFGLYDGTVSSISNSVLVQNELPINLKLDEPAYKVIVTLEAQSITAYNENYSLKPGMLLSADVILDKRSLFEWLLEPLYSLRGTI